jgi:predicted  nucleic acid-binding Zn-ribbon protein
VSSSESFGTALDRIGSIERELAGLRRSLENHEVARSLAIAVGERDAQESALREARGRVEALAEDEQRIEGEVRVLREKLVALRRHATSDMASDFRGADALEHEITATNDRLEVLELEALELLETQDAAEGNASELEEATTMSNAGVALLEASWEELSSGLSARIAELDRELEEAVGALDPRSADLYRRISGAQRRLVLSRVDGGHCELCGATISPYERGKLEHMGELEALTAFPRCEECGAILRP